MKQPHSPPSKLQLVYSSVQNLSCSGICLILLGGINIPSPSPFVLAVAFQLSGRC